MKIENYYLDLQKVNSIESKSDREQIHRYYMDMMHCSMEGREPMAQSLLNTLIKGGYLIDFRNEKIEKILNE